MNLKLKCDKNNLLDAVNIVLKAVPSKTTMEILSCILLIADDKGLRFISNDLQMGIETTPIEADIETIGAVAVDAKLFAEFLRSLPDGEVLIECADKKNKSADEDAIDYSYIVNIKSGKTKFKLMGANEKLFPYLAEFNKITEININSQLLKDMIRKTIFSTATDETRPAYTGEFFDMKNGSLSVISADSGRLSMINTSVELNNNESFIVPAKTLNELVKILPESDEVINIALEDKNVMFTANDFKMSSRLIEGKFIDYEKVMPKDSNTKLKINRNMLIKSLERASIICKDDGKTPVKMSVKEDILELSSVSSKSDFFEEIIIEKVGDDLDIGFNPKFVIDALKSIEEEEVEILLKESLNPFVIVGVDNENSKYMILPTKL